MTNTNLKTTNQHVDNKILLMTSSCAIILRVFDVACFLFFHRFSLFLIDLMLQHTQNILIFFQNINLCNCNWYGSG